MGIKVVLSQEEAESKVLEPIPAGWYKVTISDVELKESKSEKNPGKPFYAIEHTVSEGDHEGRKVFSNVMLWAGAGYNLAQLLKALDVDVEGGVEVEVPEPDEMLGKEVYAKVKRVPPRTVTVNGEKKEYEARNEVNGYKHLSEEVKTGSSAPAKTSLLPS